MDWEERRFQRWGANTRYHFGHGLVDCKRIRADFAVFSDYRGGPSNLRKRMEKKPGGAGGAVLGGVVSGATGVWWA